MLSRAFRPKTDVMGLIEKIPVLDVLRSGMSYKATVVSSVLMNQNIY